MISRMPGLRERKKLATRLAIHQAGMRLFGEHGFSGTTVDDIAEAAGVSRATVFTYFPTKEEIVFGDAASAVEGLRALLAEGGPVIPVVRGWLRQLTGWLDAELLVQRAIIREAPTVARNLDDKRPAALSIRAGISFEPHARENAEAEQEALNPAHDSFGDHVETDHRRARPARDVPLRLEHTAQVRRDHG